MLFQEQKLFQLSAVRVRASLTAPPPPPSLLLRISSTGISWRPVPGTACLYLLAYTCPFLNVCVCSGIGVRLLAFLYLLALLRML